MHSRVVEILFQPDKVQPVIERFRATSIGLIAAIPGARGFMGSLSRETGRTYTVSFWDTSEQRDASALDPAIIENLAGYASWMAGPFTRDSCDVPVFSFVAIDPADPYPPEFVAAASGLAVPQGWLETLALLADRTSEIATATGSRGACVMTNPTSGRILRMQLWDTLPAAQAARDRMAVDDLDLRHEGQLTGAPVYDVHEVAGRWTAP
jgi:hypothetical protein